MFGRRKIQLKSDAELAAMSRAGVVTSLALDAAVAAAVPGATTADLDHAFRDVLDEYDAQSNFLGYYGYPATVCTSCLLYTSPSPRDATLSRMPSSA